MERVENKEKMPSQIQGYPDTSGAAANGNMPPYSWPSQQQQQQKRAQASPPTVTQHGRPYYGYPVAPAASYDSHHSPYPQRSSTDTNQGTDSQPEEAHQGSVQNYSNYSSGTNPEAPSSQERVGPSSSPSGNSNSYDQLQQPQDFTRPPEANSSTYASSTMQSHSMETVASTENKPSPPSMPPTYGQAMPYTFFVNQPPYPQYAWTPYGPGPYPPPPPPHARRSLAQEYSAATHRSQTSSETTKSKKNIDKGKIERVRTMSPSQLESCRRDEVANMGCTCKKSKCLKLYCMCFGASVVCGPNCRCLVCFNTPDHEAERKEAVRGILSRNPAAFDTKFKKTSTGGTSTDKSGSGTEGGEGTTEKVLSHKIGCKCRKSQCTKKYCECFNAGIKCSATCRCTGCQNMPPGGFGPDPRYGFPIIPTAPYAAAAMMPSGTSIAAQKLAFLKNSSPNKPVEQPVAAPRNDANGVASMPPTVASDATPSLATESSPQSAYKSEEGGVANALLMAAYAMTELHADESPRKPVATDYSGTTLRASPKRKSSEFAGNTEGYDEGDDSGSAAYDSPPKPFPNVETQFDDDEDQGDAAMAAVTETPLTKHRKSKRSRVGTHKKLPLARKAAVGKSSRKKNTRGSDEEPENKSPRKEAVVESTPMTRSRSSRKSSPKDALTPVSARCIDFRRMDVKGKNDGE